MQKYKVNFMTSLYSHLNHSLGYEIRCDLCHQILDESSLPSDKARASWQVVNVPQIKSDESHV